MTAKEFLHQYRNIQADIDALREEISQIELASECARYDYDKAVYIYQQRRKMGNKLINLLDVKDSIEAVTCRITDEQQQRVIRLHYINGYSFQRIANILHYTRENVFCIHRKALKNVEIIMQQDIERGTDKTD